MKAAFLGLIGSFALLGASCSCSVKDFAPVALEKVSYANSYTMPPKNAIDAGDISDYYGKYAFRFGNLGKNLLDASNFYDYANNHYINGRFVCRNGSNTSGNVKALLMNGSSIFEARLNSINASGLYSFSCNRSSAWNRLRLILSGNYSDAYIDYDFNVLNIPYNVDLTFSFSLQFSVTDCVFYNLMLNEGATALPYQPYAWGFSYDTPITGAGAVALTRDEDGYPQDIAIYNDGNFRLDSGFLAWNFSGASDLGSSFIDLLQVAQEQGTFVNMDWEPNTEGWHEIGFGPSDTSLPAYCEFEVGSSASYDNLGMVSHLSSLVVSYYYHSSPSAEEWSRYSMTYTNSAVGVVLPCLYGGLVNVRELCRRVTSTDHYDANEYSFRFIYDQPKNINSDPLYIDYHTNTDFTDVQLATRFDVIYRNNGVVSYPFAVDLMNDYVGTLNNYNINDHSFDYATDGLYNEVRVKLPETDTGGELRWFGILSAYANGYADGYASRNTEIDDLTDRILGLEDDLSQYQGRSYEEIYNMGKADGMQSGNNANQVLSGLFGAILSVPMSIFGGLGDMTIVGVSVMSLIASLLLVAVAVVVIKKLL